MRDGGGSPYDRPPADPACLARFTASDSGRHEPLDVLFRAQHPVRPCHRASPIRLPCCVVRGSPSTGRMPTTRTVAARPTLRRRASLRLSGCDPR